MHVFGAQAMTELFAEALVLASSATGHQVRVSRARLVLRGLLA